LCCAFPPSGEHWGQHLRRRKEGDRAELFGVFGKKCPGPLVISGSLEFDAVIRAHLKCGTSFWSVRSELFCRPSDPDPCQPRSFSGGYQRTMHQPQSSWADKVFVIIRYIHAVCFHIVQKYVHSLRNMSAIGFFTSAAFALISHKIIFIALQSPISISGVIFTSPCLFLFDIITLLILHAGFSSWKRIYHITAYFCAIIIIILCSAFASLYITANTELQWERSFEVLSLIAVLV